jgi:large subunit ribosomal protein L16
LKNSGVLVFPTPVTYPITKKPTEVRMGKGKGGIVDWAIPLKLKSIPFLFQGKKTTTLKIFLQDLTKKLPIKSRIKESKHL